MIRKIIVFCLVLSLIPGLVLAMGKAPQTGTERSNFMNSEIITLPVVADTWIYAFKKDKNYGDGGGWKDITDPNKEVTLPKMFLGFGGSDIKIVLLKFDLSGLKSGLPIKSAKLLVYNDYAGSAAPIKVTAKVITSSWEEMKVTFRNKPSTGASLDTITLQGAINHKQPGKWYSWDITPAVQAWAAGQPNNGIMLVPQGDSGVDFELVAREYSEKSHYAPKLEVSY